MEWDSAVVAEHLTANIFANWSSSVELQEHVCLEQVLCALNLEFRDHCAQTHPFILNVEEHVLALHWVADEIDSPQAGVLVAGVEGLEAVAQV
jgi:hypothetical protein